MSSCLLSPQLQAFQAVARVQTVHGAAAELGLTQTGVTQRIRTLEESLSVTLFERSRRGMRLTPEGEALLRYCQAARDLEGPVLAQLQGARAGEHSTVQVTITGPTSILRTRVIPGFTQVMKAMPQLLVWFHIADEGREVQDLKSGSAQLAILPPERVPRELDSKMLRPERYVLAGPKAWKSRRIADIVATERMIDFGPGDEMSLRYLREFKLHERVKQERHFVNNNEALAQLIEAGVGYGVLTQEFAERFLQRCEIALLNQGRVMEHRLAMAWYPRPARTPYWDALIDSVK